MDDATGKRLHRSKFGNSTLKSIFGPALDATARGVEENGVVEGATDRDEGVITEEAGAAGSWEEVFGFVEDFAFGVHIFEEAGADCGLNVFVIIVCCRFIFFSIVLMMMLGRS